MSEEYSVAGRRFLKEKVVTSYEKLWAGQEINYPELFLLKAHAQWLHSHIASEPASQLLGPRKPIVRRLFAECCDSVSEEATADVQSHAMETLAGIFLGVGSRSFHDPVAEVPELLCGIEAADAIFGRLFAHVKRIISSERRGGGAVALRRSAVRMLLSLTAAASDLHSNILVDLLMPHGFDQPIASLLLRGGDESGANGDGGRATAIEDVALLLVLLAAYRRHESPNAFLRLISESGAEAPHLQALAHVSRRVLERCMYPAEESATASYLGASWSHSLARAAEWAAHTLTLEAYLPTSVTAQLSSPQALRANAAPLTVALLIAYELAAPRGGATLSALCAQQDAASRSAVGATQPKRGALLRHVFSIGSLLACDARDDLLIAQLRLALLIIEKALEGSASAPLLLSADLGGSLPMWTFSGVHVVESALPSPQPLLAGGYTLIASLLVQNLRKATFHPPLYLQALTLLHKLLVAQHRASQKLPLLKWSEVWNALFTTSDFISHDDVFNGRGVAEVGLRVLELINLLITLGDSLLPSSATFEAFAYELVRRHRTFEKLYRVSRKAAPRVVGAMELTRSMIVEALEAMSKMEPGRASNLSSAEALDVIRGLNPTVKPEAAAALLKPPSYMKPHDQLALSQSLMRVLLTHCRRDGSLAPLHYEDLAR